MPTITDPITTAVVAHTERAWGEVWRTESRAFLASAKSSDSAPDVALAVHREVQDRLRTICVEFSADKLLLLMRRVPLDLLLINLVGSERLSMDSFPAVVEQATMLATNAILAYSGLDHSMPTSRARYLFEPTDGELVASLRILAVAIADRLWTFSRNSLNRQANTSPVSLDALLRSYNKRLRGARASVGMAPPTSSVVVMPAFAYTLPAKARVLTWHHHSGAQRSIAIRNYVPSMADLGQLSAQYGYLDVPVFEELWGLRFPRWLAVWGSLNSLLLNSLATTVSPDALYRTYLGQFEAGIERADDYSETALGLPSIDSLIAWADSAPVQHSPAGRVSRDEIELFVTSVTLASPMQDPGFIEQPVVFYQWNGRNLFWDYLRHGCLLRAVARHTRGAAQSRRMGDIAGIPFEHHIRAEIDAQLGERVRWSAQGVKVLCKGRIVWDVDIAVAVGDCLLLIEAKNWQRTVRYSAGSDPEFVDRVAKLESKLEEVDSKLRKYRDQVLDAVGCPGLRHALVVLVTVDVEYISSTNPRLWFSTLEVPRICTLHELSTLLDVLPEYVRMHPWAVCLGPKGGSQATTSNT